MAIELTLSNMLQLFAALSPLLLSFFLVMSSLFNQSLKGLVYLAGVLMASVINIFLMNQIKSPMKPEASKSISCNLVSLPFLTQFNSPAPSSLFIAFTTAYLVLPMQYNNQMNYVILAALLCLFGLDAVTKIQNNCTTLGGSFLGALVGGILGTIWYTLFHVSGYDSLLYFDELESNNVTCSRPSKQTFKCSVYKNGELISSNVV
jgi:prepilin signal peptidase PulO-like enzyme (type II secretory pathway)|tara:strand:+ start:615 stop:1229 length:615 start_codon:yes stop_codon:yes gene_type:complete